jgi:hypothetical protein
VGIGCCADHGVGHIRKVAELGGRKLALNVTADGEAEKDLVGESNAGTAKQCSGGPVVTGETGEGAAAAG